MNPFKITMLRNTYKSLPEILSVLEFGILLPVATFKDLTLPSFLLSKLSLFALKVHHMTCT